ncbi:MAG TPA: hypothetical protein VKG92_00280 [Flavobacteriales bacterium]|nr:hypothetical protein [Flavobacteriales bacterium]
MDLESLQYTLLAYLQRVEARFKERKLYPYLDDLRAHTDELVRLRRKKEELARNIPGELLGFDPRSGMPVHERPADDQWLGAIDEVIDFAIPGLRRAWNEGSGLRQEIAGHIHFAPVGLWPLSTHEGWLLLRTGKEARVYGYTMPLLLDRTEEHAARYPLTRFVASYTLGSACTYEHIKADLIDKHRSLPNPATFVFETDLRLPHIETFMPLAKQLVYEHVARGI